MGEVVDKPATYADIEALPPNVVGKIFCGRLVTHPRPTPKHTFALTALGIEIGGPFQWGREGPGGCYMLIEPEIHLDGHAVLPDIAGWRKDRLPHLPETAAFHNAPYWVCEILSPSRGRDDKGDKQVIYAEHGGGHLWFVDPDQRMPEVRRRSGREWVVSQTHFDNAPVSAESFDAIAFSLDALWDDPETSDTSPSETN